MSRPTEQNGRQPTLTSWGLSFIRKATTLKGEEYLLTRGSWETRTPVSMKSRGVVALNLEAKSTKISEKYERVSSHPDLTKL